MALLTSLFHFPVSPSKEGFGDRRKKNRLVYYKLIVPRRWFVPCLIFYTVFSLLFIQVVSLRKKKSSLISLSILKLLEDVKQCSKQSDFSKTQRL